MKPEPQYIKLEHEQSNAVICFENDTTFKINKLMKKINEFFTQSVLNQLPLRLTESGLGTPPNYKGSCSTWNNYVNAEILEPESGEWKKGKVRMRVILEFCPDEPEEVKNDSLHQNDNSLDDIRKTIIE